MREHTPNIKFETITIQISISRSEIHHDNRGDNETVQETNSQNMKTKTTFTPIPNLHNRFNIEPESREGGFFQ